MMSPWLSLWAGKQVQNRKVFIANQARTSQTGIRYYSHCDTTGRQGVFFPFGQQRFRTMVNRRPNLCPVPYAHKILSRCHCEKTTPLGQNLGLNV